MKHITAFATRNTTVLFLLVGSAALARAPRAQEEGKPDHPKQERQQAKPEKQKNKAAQQERKQARQTEHPAQARPGQTEARPSPPEVRQAQPEVRQAERQTDRPAQARPGQTEARPVQPEVRQAQRQTESPAQQQARPPSQERAAYVTPQRTQQEARGWEAKRGWLQEGGGWQGRNTWREGRAERWESEHRTWDQRGGYGGIFISADRFSLNFGSDHWFRISSRPLIVGGYPRFQYSGYSFMLVDPWPESWAEDWYANDDVYVEYRNGYYLHNRRYPSEGIAISVVL